VFDPLLDLGEAERAGSAGFCGPFYDCCEPHSYLCRDRREIVSADDREHAFRVYAGGSKINRAQVTVHLGWGAVDAKEHRSHLGSSNARSLRHNTDQPALHSSSPARCEGELEDVQRRSYPLKYINSTRANMPSDSSASPAIPSQERSIRRNRGNGGAPPGATSPQRGHLPSV
jgi:hypothetical protein